MKQLLTPILSNSELMPGVWLLTLNAPDLVRDAKPGQFVHVLCHAGWETYLRRPLSLHRLDRETGDVWLLYHTVGPGTRWLATCQPGNLIDLVGPLGNGYTIHPKARNILLVGEGLGIASIICLAHHAVEQGLTTSLALGAPTEALIYPGMYLPPQVECIIATEDGSLGERGTVLDVIAPGIAWADAVYFATPRDRIDQARRAYPRLLTHDFAQAHLTDAPIACGLGSCYSCLIETKQGRSLLCKDGPVYWVGKVL